MMEQRNLLLAIVASVAILLGFQFFYEQPKMERERALQQQQQQIQKTPGGTVTLPGGAMPGGTAAPPAAGIAQTPVAAPPNREKIVGEEKRVRISSARLHGSIALRGGRIDDLTLPDYRETLEADSPEITLLSPPRAPNPYYAQFGWVALETGVKVPGPTTEWSADRVGLGPDKPVTLSWNNGQGLIFTQAIALDRDYMFTVTQSVRNQSGKPVSLRPYGLISRTGTPETLGFAILHEGLLGVFEETLQEVNYETSSWFSSALGVKEEGTIKRKSTGGWIGFTDKFWLTALVPDQKSPTDNRFLHNLEDKKDKYQVDFAGPGQVVMPGAAIQATNRLFAGAKEARLLDRYRDELGIVRFDLAVDWGWLWFLTKPIFQALGYFNGFLGNFGLAILLLTVLIKLAFFPLANKSYRAMSRMKKLQPKMTEIREKFKDDRARQNQEMMALYKTENANPMAGCFPIMIQIPVFFALYKVLFVSIEMRHAPFFGWIHDLSAPDPLSILTVFGLVQWDVPQILDIANIGIWPIIMGVTMFLQQKLNPQPADPTQAKIFMMLPIVFTFLLGKFPAGLVIYWAWNNLLSIAQQWVIMRKMGVSASGGTTTPAPTPKPPPRGKAKAAQAQDKEGGNAGAGKRGKKKKKNAAATGGGTSRQRAAAKRRDDPDTRDKAD